MKIQIYAVRDRATDQYGNPFYTLAHGQAIRGFTDQVNGKENNELAHHPEDFDLYHLGEYETETGHFTTKDPEMIAIGKNVKVKE